METSAWSDQVLSHQYRGKSPQSHIIFHEHKWLSSFGHRSGHSKSRQPPGGKRNTRELHGNSAPISWAALVASGESGLTGLSGSTRLVMTWFQDGQEQVLSPVSLLGQDKQINTFWFASFGQGQTYMGWILSVLRISEIIWGLKNLKQNMIISSSFIWPHSNSMIYIGLYDYIHPKPRLFFWFIPRDNDAEDMHSWIPPYISAPRYLNFTSSRYSFIRQCHFDIPEVWRAGNRFYFLFYH